MSLCRSDYGGMDVYVRQILGANQPHDAFYTNTNVKVSWAQISLIHAATRQPAGTPLRNTRD